MLICTKHDPPYKGSVKTLLVKLIWEVGEVPAYKINYPNQYPLHNRLNPMTDKGLGRLAPPKVAARQLNALEKI